MTALEKGTRPLHSRAALGQTEGVSNVGPADNEGAWELGGRARWYDIYHDQGKRVV